MEFSFLFGISHTGVRACGLSKISRLSCVLMRLVPAFLRASVPRPTHMHRAAAAPPRDTIISSSAVGRAQALQYYTVAQDALEIGVRNFFLVGLLSCSFIFSRIAIGRSG